MSLTISIYSFSYKQALPSDDSGNGGGFLFDCRCLHNPGRYDQYKALSGQDQPVIDFLRQENDVETFFQHSLALVKLAINNYHSRQFSNLLIGYGCTGGQHRSVYCAEKLARALAGEDKTKVVLTHLNQHNWVTA